jgi:hypothetical protein
VKSMDLSVIFYIVGSLLVTSMFFVLKNGMYSYHGNYSTWSIVLWLLVH